MLLSKFRICSDHRIHNVVLFYPNVTHRMWLVIRLLFLKSTKRFAHVQQYLLTNTESQSRVHLQFMVPFRVAQSLIFCVVVFIIIFIFCLFVFFLLFWHSDVSLISTCEFACFFGTMYLILTKVKTTIKTNLVENYINNWFDLRFRKVERSSDYTHNVLCKTIT